MRDVQPTPETDGRASPLAVFIPERTLLAYFATRRSACCVLIWVVFMIFAAVGLPWRGRMPVGTAGNR